MTPKIKLALGKTTVKTAVKKRGKKSKTKARSALAGQAVGEYIGTAAVGVAQGISIDFHSIRVDVHVSLPVALSAPYEGNGRLDKVDAQTMRDGLVEATRIAAKHMQEEFDGMKELLDG